MAAPKTMSTLKLGTTENNVKAMPRLFVPLTDEELATMRERPERNHEMIIKVNGEYWSNEQPGCWVPIPESAISYGIYTREPEPEVIAAIMADLHEAVRLDIEEEVRVGLPAGCVTEGGNIDIGKLFAFDPAPSKHYSEAKRKHGTEYLAMRAYEDFRLCMLESVGQ